MTNENAINILRHLSPPRTSKAAFDAFRQAIEMAIEALKKSNIIRCKDCTHRDKYGCCTHWRGLAMGDIPVATDDNDFCSYAERRTE